MFLDLHRDGTFDFQPQVLALTGSGQTFRMEFVFGVHNLGRKLGNEVRRWSRFLGSFRLAFAVMLLGGIGAS
jgi:hypothetical protein